MLNHPAAAAATSQERSWAQRVAWILAATAFTGLATLLPAPFASAWQPIYLAHVVLGIAGGSLLLPYISRHLARTLRIRRPALLITGVLLSAVFVALAGSGLWILYYGQTERLAFVYLAHVWSGVAAVALAVLHLATHGAGRRTAGRLWERVRDFETLDRSDLRRSIRAVAGVAVAALLLGALYPSPRPSELRSELLPYETPYGEHPFAPSQTLTSHGGFVRPSEIGNSETCARCHAEIHAMWRASIHSQAASDPAYERNVGLLAEKKGIAATRYCEGCHAPVALLSGELTKGGVHGGISDSIANDQGVSCMSCHGIDQVVHLKGVASYRFNPSSPYLFAESKQPVLRAVHDFLLRIHPQEHKNLMARDVLGDPKLCASCHAQFMDKDINSWGWVKMQDDYSAWLESPFSGLDKHGVEGRGATRCQDCHFPKVAAEDPSADRNGLVRSHYSLGGNTAIPWVTGNPAHVARTKEFLNGKLQVSIETARVHGPPDTSSDASTRFYVAVSNTAVGHGFPGGTLDVNEAWIEVQVTDAGGTPVFRSGWVEPGGDVEPGAHFYRTTPIDRQGRPVWRHDLFNMIGESYRRAVASGEIDLAEYSFEVPTTAVRPLRVEAALRYRKLNNRYARWALQIDRPELPIVEVAAATATLP